MTWQIGDRVYVVAQPELVGTVIETDGGVDGFRVRFDARGNRTDASWYTDAELECYTRPARESFPEFAPITREGLDKLGNVMARVSGAWYEQEYGVNGAGDWYKRAMFFLEDLYAVRARELYPQSKLEADRQVGETWAEVVA